ncbi:vWA domain-containing protein [Streptomyces angustmyceticus]|uniref:vWA domain-containing protein n=1 Tax=Streptomyces angustmyceticus TaxID=285578 RepID=UPI0021AF90CA|nr:VWA domain-containing protein [Streptomyces angustmyceticus]
MGIRSLLRNAFGRSKATREETGAAPSGADKPESATIPEAREESAPGAATPEAEVPAARTAPTETPDTDPAPAPKTPTLPAQGGRADRGERDDRADRGEQVAQAEKTSAARDDVEAEAPEAAAPAASDLVSQAFDKPTQTPAADAEPAAAPAEAAEPQAEPEPVAEVQETPAAEPVAEAKATTDAAEPKAEPADEPAAEVVAKSAAAEVVAKPADAKVVAEPAAEPETAPETEAKAAAEPAPETEAKAADQPAPEPEPKPEAAAPAPEAEPKADVEAKPEPEPKADATPEAAPSAAPATAEAEPRPETPGSPGSLPAVAPALVSLYKSAGATLDKHGLATQRAAVYLVLDRSGSMRNYYKDGTVQNLAEQALGLAAHFDDDATVPVVFFSTDIDGTADIDLTNYEGRIAELHAGLGHMGRTNYHWAVDAVVDHYKKSGSTAPAFVIFQTDGAPTSKPAAEKAICEAAGLPIFWQFIGFGDPDAKGFDFLRKLDDLTVPEKRAVDNAGFFHAGRDPRGLSHDELYQQLMVEFPEWLAEARTAGIVKDN